MAPLNQENFQQGVAYLCKVDPHLAQITARYGLPPMWSRPPGFATLVTIVLEQQVSLSSARAAFTKLQEAIETVTPENFLQLNDEELKRVGLSRQKSSYCRGLAQAILSRELDLEALAGLEDASARAALMKIKGIGPWTADNYLLMALLRPDIWPSGDLALAAAIQELKALPTRPAPEELERIALPWQPWRAVAARLVWHYYLSQRKQS